MKCLTINCLLHIVIYEVEFKCPNKETRQERTVTSASMLREVNVIVWLSQSKNGAFVDRDNSKMIFGAKTH